MGNPIYAIRSSGAFKPLSVSTATGLSLSSGTTNHRINASSVSIIDSIIGGAEDGRRVFFLGKTGTSSIVFRDDQSGTNLKLAGTSFSMLQADSIEFIYDADSGFWIEIGNTNA
ncbi:MAG: hypothetical protein JKY67_00085 [Pseudomonadales bacterium]|nr:hypothetical protein [Pseudomonadales bacterium]